VKSFVAGEDIKAGEYVHLGTDGFLHRDAFARAEDITCKDCGRLVSLERQYQHHDKTTNTITKPLCKPCYEYRRPAPPVRVEPTLSSIQQYAADLEGVIDVGEVGAYSVLLRITHTHEADLVGIEETIRKNLPMWIKAEFEFHPSKMPPGYWNAKPDERMRLKHRNMGSKASAATMVSPACECGTDAAGGGLHSGWCPKGEAS